jgi:hypothetical protein
MECDLYSIKPLNQEGMRLIAKHVFLLTLYSGQHSIALWTTYLYFEVAKGDDESLKRVVHRGLSQIPWSKSFIMLGLKMLNELGASFSDLRSLHQVLEDRELRVHLVIADVVAQSQA